MGRPKQTPTEREDAEFERRIRPSTDVLPARKDRRREKIEMPDPDLDEKDRDMSLRENEASLSQGVKMNRKSALTLVARIDRLATTIQNNPSKLGITPKKAEALALHLDHISDTLERASTGDAAFEARKAAVLEGDADEKYMATFNDTTADEIDQDETYMAEFGKSIDGDDDNWDAVTLRPEVAVRDLNEWANGTDKQPSWEGEVVKDTEDLTDNVMASNRRR